jgi:hypothetical protein
VEARGTRVDFGECKFYFWRLKGVGGKGKDLKKAENPERSRGRRGRWEGEGGKAGRREGGKAGRRKGGKAGSTRFNILPGVPTPLKTSIMDSRS